MSAKVKVISQILNLGARRALVVTVTLFATITMAAQAVALRSVENFNCGTLGKVTLQSSKPIFSGTAGHTVSAAQLCIPSRRIQQKGILHSFMAGNDRTFTRRETDAFRSVDDTSTTNPVMKKVRVGSFFYGKKREEVTLEPLKEAYTCIPD